MKLKALQEKEKKIAIQDGNLHRDYVDQDSDEKFINAKKLN